MSNLEKILSDSIKGIDSAYKDMAVCRSIAKHIVKDLDTELSKIKWVSDDEAWNKAIEAVRKELKTRYNS
jgi:hypothetical protein